MVKMTIQAKLKSWGNSLGVIVPSEVINNLNLKEGETVIIDITQKKKNDGFGIFKGGPSFKRDPYDDFRLG